MKELTRGMRTYTLTAMSFRHREQRHRKDGGNAVSHPVDRLDVRGESTGGERSAFSTLSNKMRGGSLC